ncbi:MAG: hypothetical protein AseanaTS_02600 [Candidatus Pelagadaptatus aseana]|uniref:hypothetical protein n=1 Tax=Candidatus Pelagadaptatus aseana TaxID=3120508 RepID=UPI0039B24460
MAQPAVSLVNVDSMNSCLMRERLLQEITRLERDLERLQCNDRRVDRSLEQTYREMIHARREILGSLPN